MPIFHNPNCLYEDPIQYCLCEIYSCSLQLFTHGTVLITLLFVCYTFSPKHVATGIVSLGYTYLEIVLMQFDNNVSTNLKNIVYSMYRQCSCLYRYSPYIFNIGTYSDPYSSIGATLIYNYICLYISW